MSRRQWTGQGEQEISGDRQRVGLSRHEELYRYAVASKTHMWVAVISHAASDDLLRAMTGDDEASLPILDVDTMLGPPAIGCYVCEQTYEPQLRLRRCPGEPGR